MSELSLDTALADGRAATPLGTAEAASHRIETRPRVLFDRALIRTPRISLILLDWSCRESFHILDYLARQDVPRDWFEVIWIEYYALEAPDIQRRLDEARARGTTTPVDRWIAVDMPRTAYYHKHLMYNLGVVASRGDLILIGDSDAMVKPEFVRHIIETFDADPDIVLHLDEVRSHSRRFYPFNYPTFEAVLADDCINWTGTTTTGIHETDDPLHALNYGACFVAWRADVLAIGGADEHTDYLGHICGPYDLTWRLVNYGRREVWHPSEFLYHTWHPGSDGGDNYLGPHDGRNVSTVALTSRRTGRVMPLVENPLIRRMREHGESSDVPLVDALTIAVDGRPSTAWVIDDLKRSVSAGREAWAQHRHQDAVAIWEPLRQHMLDQPKFLSDLAWSYYSVGRHVDALECFDASLLQDPSSAYAHRGRGWTLLVHGRHADAVDAFGRAIDFTDPLDRVALQEAHRGRGWGRIHLSHMEAALADFHQALTLTRSGDVDGLQDLQRGIGWVLLRQRRFGDAVRAFTLALDALGDRRGPDYEDAMSGRRQAQSMVAPYSATVSLSVEPEADQPATARRSQPIDANALRNGLEHRVRCDLAWAYVDRGRWSDAYALFKEALAFDPAGPRALCGVGVTALGLGDVSRARRMFKSVLSRDAGSDPWLSARAYEGWAWVQYRSGRPGGAVKDFTRALRLALKSGDVASARRIRRGRSLAHWLDGDRDRAFEDWREAGGTSRLRFAIVSRARELRRYIAAPRLRSRR